MMPEPLPAAATNLAQAAHRFFPNASEVTPVSVSDRIVRVVTSDGRFAMYAWPADASRERVEFAHRLRRQLSASGFALLPPAHSVPAEPNETVLTIAGTYFEARVWLPGEPLGQPPRPAAGEPIDLPVVVQRPILIALVETIARLHQALPAPAHPPASETLPLRRLDAAAEQLWQAYRIRLRPAAARQPDIQHWLRVGERALPAARHLLATQPDLAQQTSVAGHNRFWPAHVLVREQQISGLVGFSDPAWGSPLLDLAQIATRFARWSPATVEDVLGSYVVIRPLSPPERRLLPAVAVLDVVIQVGRLLDLAYGPEAPASDNPALTAAIAMLLASLDAAAGTLAPAKPRSARRWHRTRGPRR